MRDFKFRIWNCRTKEFVNPYYFALKCNIAGENSQILESAHLFAPYSERNIDCFEIQQYTGLKDKNGQEIYEGDFLQVQSEEGIIWHKPVIFKNGNFQLNEWNLFKDFIEEGIPVKVIGNIYQNPELLKN